jgi:hypothetical protein
MSEQKTTDPRTIKRAGRLACYYLVDGLAHAWRDGASQSTRIVDTQDLIRFAALAEEDPAYFIKQRMRELNDEPDEYQAAALEMLERMMDIKDEAAR